MWFSSRRTSATALALCALAVACAAVSPTSDFIIAVPQTPAVGFGGPPPDGCTLGVTGGFCAGADLSCAPAGMAHTHRMCGTTYIDELDVGQMPTLTQFYSDVAALAGHLNAIKSALVTCPAGMQPSDPYRCASCAPGTYSDAHDAQPCLPVTAVPMCAAYATTANACVECAPGSTLDEQNNMCSGPPCPVGTGQNGDCDVACYAGYYNDGTHAACRPVTPVYGCAGYATTADECTACDTGMSLVGAVCVACPREIEPFSRVPAIEERYAVHDISDEGVAVSLSVDTVDQTISLTIFDGARSAIAQQSYSGKACDGGMVHLYLNPPDYSHSACTLALDRPSEFACVCAPGYGYTAAANGVTCKLMPCRAGFGQDGDCNAVCVGDTYNDGTLFQCEPVVPVEHCTVYYTTTGECRSCTTGLAVYDNECITCPIELAAFANLGNGVYTHEGRTATVDVSIPPTGASTKYITVTYATRAATYAYQVGTMSCKDCAAGSVRSMYATDSAAPCTTYSVAFGYPSRGKCSKFNTATYMCADAQCTTVVERGCPAGFGDGGDCAVACTQGTYNDGGYDACVRVSSVDNCAAYSTTSGACIACEPPHTMYDTPTHPVCDTCGVNKRVAKASYIDTETGECIPCATIAGISDCAAGVMGGMDCTCREW